MAEKRDKNWVSNIGEKDKGFTRQTQKVGTIITATLFLTRLGLCRFDGFISPHMTLSHISQKQDCDGGFQVRGNMEAGMRLPNKKFNYQNIGADIEI